MMRWMLPLLFILPAQAQEVTITAPATVARGSFALISVTGVSPKELTDLITARTLTVNPADGIFVAPMLTAPAFFLLVSQEASVGQRTITLPAMNGWIKPLLDSSAASQGVASDEDGKRMLAIAQEMAGKYPYRPHATAVLEVTGPRPPPPDQPSPKPDDPNQPPPTDPSLKVSQVTYVYEKDQTQPPKQVSLALQRINVDSGYSVVASEFEEDTLNGAGQVPAQYKIALAAAQKAGLPALVVQAGAIVLRVVKNPTTEAQVLEAAK